VRETFERERKPMTSQYAHVDSADVDALHPTGTVSVFSEDPTGTVSETVLGRTTLVDGIPDLDEAASIIRAAGFQWVGEWDGIDTGSVIDVRPVISAEEMDRRASFGPPVR
jgi:hypothetical protein